MRFIGKSEWFTYRIFGWGLRPRTWEGWAYIGLLVAIIVGLGGLPLQEPVRVWAIGAIVAVGLVDMLVIMMDMSRTHDERERMHQLIIERNVSYAAITAIIAIALYQGFVDRTLFVIPGLPFDASLLWVLGVMTVAKIGSAFYARYRL